MPTIAQAVASNQQLKAAGATTVPPTPDLPSADLTAGASMGLPIRGTLPATAVIGTDFYEGAQAFRFSQRSALPLALTRQSQPQSLLNKRLVGPTIGGGVPLNRYNKVTGTVVPISVGSGAHSSQAFVVVGVQAADRLIGYQWLTPQTQGVTVLAVRVTANNQVTIDFYNPTGGSLTPTGGQLVLFLGQ